MWISVVDLPLKRREALCLAVSEGALPNIQMVSLCSLLLCCFTFDNCEGRGGRVMDSQSFNSFSSMKKLEFKFLRQF